MGYAEVTLIVLFCLVFSGDSFRFSKRFHFSPFHPLNPSTNIIHNAVKQPQILEFVEPVTNVSVVLIGSMHYNPTSIALAKNTINNLANTANLGSVLVESCPIRWNRSSSIMPPAADEHEKLRLVTKNNNYISNNNGQTKSPLFYLTDDDNLQQVSLPDSIISTPVEEGINNDRTSDNGKENSSYNKLLRQVLYNEMVAAYDTASQYQIPVVLADQLINITNMRCQAAFKSSLMDLLQPWQGGWQRLSQDIQQATALALPSGPEYLGASDFFDSRLLLSTPFTLIRYPLALLLKAPQLFVPIFLVSVYPFLSSLYFLPSDTTLTTPNNLADIMTVITTTSGDSNMALTLLQDALTSMLIFMVEGIVLSRVFLVTILAERNVVLARAILQQCESLASSNNSNNKVNVIPDGKNGNNSLQAMISAMVSQVMKTTTSNSVHNKQVQSKTMNPLANNVTTAVNEKGKKSVVVAVLGMAHCNGIKQLIESQQVASQYALLTKSQQELLSQKQSP